MKQMLDEMKLFEAFLFAIIGLIFGVMAGRQYEASLPLPLKDPVIVELEKENREIELRIEYIKGQNEQLRRCNQILEIII